jgi:hypothetical protein
MISPAERKARLLERSDRLVHRERIASERLFRLRCQLDAVTGELARFGLHWPPAVMAGPSAGRGSLTPLGNLVSLHLRRRREDEERQ